MLDIHNILWVVPGVIFIYLYNKRRPSQSIDLSGWSYIFFLVFIAVPTWLPSEWLSNFLFEKNELVNELTASILFSIIVSFMLFLIIQRQSILEKVIIPVQDNFYKKCIEWENEEIILTLKNDKVYKALLWKYPDNPKSRHESQTISIVPLQSGYRESKTKEVIWNVYYPKYEKYSDLADMEVIISRTEIVTFGKFNNKTFDHFKKQNSRRKMNDKLNLKSDKVSTT